MPKPTKKPSEEKTSRKKTSKTSTSSSSSSEKKLSNPMEFKVENRIRTFMMKQKGLSTHYKMGPEANAFVKGALRAHVLSRAKITAERMRKGGHSQFNAELI